jgi:hypothetical protein
LSEAIARVDHADIWSALDANAARNLLRYSTGAVARLADYNAVKKSIRSAQYTLDVTSGLKFDFTLSTSDAFTATTLSSLLQAYFLFQKLTSAKPALPAGQLTVESESSDVRISLDVPEAGLQEFLKSQFFVAVSR